MQAAQQRLIGYMALQENPTLLHTVIELLVRSCWKWAFIGKSGWRPRLPLAPISQAGRFSCSPKFVFDTQHIHRTPNQHVKIPDRPWTSNMISRIGRGLCPTNFVLQELEKKVKFQLSANMPLGWNTCTFWIVTQYSTEFESRICEGRPFFFSNGFNFAKGAWGMPGLMFSFSSEEFDGRTSGSRPLTSRVDRIGICFLLRIQ